MSVILQIMSDVMEGQEKERGKKSVWELPKLEPIVMLQVLPCPSYTCPHPTSNHYSNQLISSWLFPFLGFSKFLSH